MLSSYEKFSRKGYGPSRQAGEQAAQDGRVSPHLKFKLLAPQRTARQVGQPQQTVEIEQAVCRMFFTGFWS